MWANNMTKTQQRERTMNFHGKKLRLIGNSEVRTPTPTQKFIGRELQQNCYLNIAD